MFSLISVKRVIIDLPKVFFSKKKSKLYIIIGPCSVSNIKDFYFYINKLKKIFTKNYVVIIRIYYEKPRSSIGWKGYIYDPYLDNSYSIIDSIYILRNLMINIIKKNMLIGVECLNFYLTNYFIDLIFWVCLGARTMLSQIHREYCSNLKCIVAIKNELSGKISYLKDTFIAISNKHYYIDFSNNRKFTSSLGNLNCHFVLRGGNLPNFVNLNKLDIKPLIVDCSHMNSNKYAINQLYVYENVLNQFLYLKTNIIGFMLESNLNFGKQTLNNNFIGVSITDSCINLKFTKILILLLNNINVKL
ncbi:3-deoxy-7-phosphoheptulonate synthase [Candidatus Carsonella ruddii PV]|uniref:3-deoxy-7-phosphoheptulonate synthase n=1 Tax=Carsonella ruddii (strain PV) TaxID=387662 RepID=Q05FP6_CARRP|nr:3-deoxy-7-phosphoheptulonate synthase [Candidatus Carsonella ruddii]BAF35125.1 3-deoxy-7-phosphoheptulonate synthase [Candidatus Carsonella ruddii PV]